jgi:diguanylate cyclase (GGDEF)-like protein
VISEESEPEIASSGEQVPLPVMKVLLEGISAHSLKVHPDEHSQFRDKLRRILHSMAEDQPLSEAMLQAKAVVQALREHSERTNRRLHAQQAEQAAILRLILETLEDLRIARPEKMEQLTGICGKLTTETDAEQLRLGKLALSDCLAQIRKEAVRQWTTAEQGAYVDTITGLPGRPVAESALKEACAAETENCAVILALERIPLYNRRYGRDVGDKVLRFFAQFVRRSFSSAERLYRWTGPSVLLLCPGTVEKTTAEARRVMEPKLHYDLDTHSRTVLLALETRWVVLPMMVDPRLLINKIDAFVSR